MRRFAALFRDLDEGPRGEREAALVAYFRDAPAADAAWTVAWLTGTRPRRAVAPAQLRAWAAEAAGVALWLVEESERTVGDLAETVAHLLEGIPGERREWSLHELVGERLLPLGSAGDGKRELLLATWRELPPGQHLSWNKLVTGTFRLSVGIEMVARAIAAATGCDPAASMPESTPLLLDAVLLYAQRGEGRRSTHYVDYTFGVWHEGELVPVAKTGKGLAEAEVEEVDRWVRRNIVERFGPVRQVRPELVFQLAFDAVNESHRHKAGLSLCAPRVVRWRRERRAEEAGTLEGLRRLLAAGSRSR